MGQFTQVGPRCLKGRHLRRARPLPTLSAHAHHCCISFVALILHSLLRCRSDCLLVRILRQIAVAPNYFFPIYDSNQPLSLACVPGNFHLIRSHIRLLAPLRAVFSVRRRVQRTLSFPLSLRTLLIPLAQPLVVQPWCRSVVDFLGCSILNRRTRARGHNFYADRVKGEQARDGTPLECL